MKKLLLITIGPNRVKDSLVSHGVDIIDLGLRFLDKRALHTQIHSLVTTREYDILLTYRCPHLISADLRAHFSLCLNIHPLTLPKYAGLNPWPKFMDSGDLEAEVVIHEMTNTYDSGTFLASKKYPRGENMVQTRDMADQSASQLILDLWNRLG